MVTSVTVIDGFPFSRWQRLSSLPAPGATSSSHTIPLGWRNLAEGLLCRLKEFDLYVGVTDTFDAHLAATYQHHLGVILEHNPTHAVEQPL